MPLLVLKHAKGLAKDKVPHDVEAEPQEQVSHVCHLLQLSILLDALVKLIDIFENFGFMLRQG